MTVILTTVILMTVTVILVTVTVILTTGAVILMTFTGLLTNVTVLLATGTVILTTGTVILTTVILMTFTGILTTVTVLLATGTVILTTGTVILTTGTVILTTGAVILTTGLVILTTGTVILTTGTVILTIALKGCNLTETIDKLCDNSKGASARYIVHEMLPCIYARCKTGSSDIILSLASVALCKHREVQHWALTLLELACLDHTVPLCNPHHLVSFRIIGKKTQCDLPFPFTSTWSEAALEDEGCVQLFHRLGNLLLLLQANITGTRYQTYSYVGVGDRNLPHIAR
ncbi:protein asteroid [Elysia marginata]|uniref:Protein asteroid n=1 Tax=Elysia marginata TaxID=1093978 RepID=A0AAV4JHI9_9GAST|nr:protein asteroid [Elysia marginata]